MKLLRWLKKSFEGRDGNASGRKLTIFVFTVMFVITWFVNLFYNKVIDSGILLIIGIFITVGWAILTSQNVVDILKRPSNSFYDNDIYNPMGRKSKDNNDDEMEVGG